MRARSLAFWVLVLACCSAAAAADPFAEGVRSTEPLSPAEEQKSFVLPPGFEIQLVAAEPEIQKPLNMAFDARGRLWITDTIEYPYAAPADRPGRDSIKILEDADGDGQAERITTFADGLNIPIGLYPYQDGVIAFSIPNIWYLADTDGDGRCDHREILYGPFDTSRDTHGMCNAFRRGFDGWLYACHGFNNQSKVKGRDGNVVTMHSGNTFRVRLDGGRIEHFTRGQVNPFGMTGDAWGNLFTADCHSKPIYQLLRGGYYPSFGKPDDGLGFVPPMMNHLHGSTAIAGLVQYDGENFPPEYRGQMLSGNVMTSRINRNALEFHGSTIKAIEQPDFLSTTDPWFRPVDLQVGPDGALYIADFYNRIIGHYEVPLTHPQRDRHRGRLWRVVYQGDDAATRPAKLPRDLATATTVELIAAFENPVLNYRLRAADELVDRVGAACVSETSRALRTSTNSQVRVHALWVLHRLKALETRDVEQALASADPQLRTHAFKVAAETSTWPPALAESVRAGLKDENAFAARAAAEALGRHPDAAHVAPLLELLQRAPAEDQHLSYVGRRALREQLSQPGAFAALQQTTIGDRERPLLVQLATAVASEEASRFLLHQLPHLRDDPVAAARAFEHLARHLPADEADRAAEAAAERYAVDLDFQTKLLQSFLDGLQRRGQTPGAKLTAWGRALVPQLFASDAEGAWRALPVADKSNSGAPWGYQSRVAADGQRSDKYLGSLAAGEQATGVLRSPAFTIPPRLSFYLCGHVGPPGQPSQQNCFVRLRSAANDAVLVEVEPPRNDTAQKVEWDLAAHAGAQGYLELVDANDHDAYAWLALARLEPTVAAWPLLTPQAVAARRQAAAQLAGRLQMRELQGDLARILTDEANPPAVQQAVAQALVALTPDSRAAALAGLLGADHLPDAVRRQIAGALAQRDEAQLAAALVAAFRAAPQRTQGELAQALIADRAGAESLVGLVEQGKASARLLARPTVRERLAALQDEVLQQRAAALTAGLPSENGEVHQLIAARLAAFAAKSPAAERGAAVFAKNCAACHQIGGQGALVGPQLDGIGGRGVERIVEDLLDPNRNVDVAFRTTTLITDEGRVLTGLMRREEGATLVLVNEKGEEFALAKDSIEARRTSTLSLMPDNVARALPEQEFYDLVGYLAGRKE